MLGMWEELLRAVSPPQTLGHSLTHSSCLLIPSLSNNRHSSSPVAPTVGRGIGGDEGRGFRERERVDIVGEVEEGG